MNLLLIQPEEMINDIVAEIKGRRAEHMIKILKVKVGDIVKAGLLNDLKGIGEIISIENKVVQVKLDLNTPPPAPLPLNLVIAMQRPQTFKKFWNAPEPWGLSIFTLFIVTRWKKVIGIVRY